MHGSPPPARRSGSPGWTSAFIPEASVTATPDPAAPRCCAGRCIGREDPAGSAVPGLLRRGQGPQGRKRAALTEARKIIRRACHILSELGDDALAVV